jgi:hypothetical protein
MNASPCGRIAASSCASASIRPELALGMEPSLESTEREIDQVREVLRKAVEELMKEFGCKAAHETAAALQFQDIFEQLLASAATSAPTASPPVDT